MLSPEWAREDLRIAASLLQEVHPDPYRYVTKGDLDRMVQQIWDSLYVPVSEARFRTLLMPVFHAIGDGTCQPQQPSLPASALMLPIQVQVEGNEVLVYDEPKGFRSIPRGSRIVSINGSSIEEMMEVLRNYVVADGRNQTLRDELIAAQWSAMIYNHLDQSDRFQLAYEDPDGSQSEVPIIGMTRDEEALSSKPTGIELAPWHSTIHPDQDALWLSLESLEMAELEAAKVDPAKYLKALRKEMQRKNIKRLVIDVRGTGGQELAMAELVFSFIAQQEFRVVQDMSVRSVSLPTDYAHTNTQPAYYSTVADLFMPNGAGSYSVLPTDHRLEFIPPMRKPFTGKVHVVCDGGTRDAAAALVMIAKRTGRARTIGEETGSNALSFTGGRTLEVTLPNSGLRFPIPLVRYVPEGLCAGPQDRGEMPHHIVLPRAADLAKGRDTVKSALLQLFNELQ